MGKRRSLGPAKEQKSSLQTKGLKNLHITSKKVKHEKTLQKKIKHQKHDWTDDNSEIMTFKTLPCLKVEHSKISTHKKRKGMDSSFKGGQSNPANIALDEYFKSIETQDEQRIDVDPFGDSICEKMSLQHTNCNVSFGALTYDPDSVTSDTRQELAVKSLASGSAAQLNCDAIPKIEKAVKLYSLAHDKTMIVMKHPTSLYFQGQLNVKVLAGSLEVLGSTLAGDRPNGLEVFSPGGSSLLCLTTVSVHNMSHKETVKYEKLMALGINPELAKSIKSELATNDCLVVVEKSHSHFANYLRSQCSIYLYPRTNNKSRPFFEEENKLHCQFETDKQKIPWGYTKLQEWDDLADAIVSEGRFSNGTKRIMICGGKSVGKSTLLRFLVNKALPHFGEVLCLDFDPGQSEFTVPGCVSVVRIQAPLVGPNYTHLLRPERMVCVGDVDMSKCPNRYIKSAQHILDYCGSQPDLQKMVWFINTMGFSKGLGVDLTTCLIHIVQPSRLVQIESKSAKRNFPKLLTSDYARNSDSQWCRKVMDSNITLNYLHHILPSAAEKNVTGVKGDWGMQPKTARDIMVLSYISQMIHPPNFSFTDVLPIKRAFAKISLSVCHETLSYAQYLSAMNANLVALCVTAEEDCVLQPSDPTMPSILATPPVGPCLGFGIVRGIDMEARLLYLITPLPLEELETVNCLVLGAVMLPECVYTKARSGIGHIPYVATGPGQATSKGISRRFFLPLKQQAALKSLNRK